MIKVSLERRSPGVSQNANFTPGGEGPEVREKGFEPLSDRTSAMMTVIILIVGAAVLASVLLLLILL